MGTLTKYRLDNSDCEIFFETGTGTGASLQHALDAGNFDKLFSYEIDPNTYNKVDKIFSKFENVEILNKDSISSLKYLLPKIDSNIRVLFFLDAHFPGETEEEFNPNDRKSDLTSLPLKEEIKLIYQFRPKSNDVIIIDDLRIYEDGDYDNGNVPKGYANLKDNQRDLSFIEELFPDRIIRRFYDAEGFMIILPAENNFTLTRLSAVYRAKRSIKRNLKKFFPN